LAWSLLLFGAFLDGTIIGRETRWITGIKVPGMVGKFHPVALYGLILSILSVILMLFIQKLSWDRKLKSGVIGFSSLSLLGFTFLVLAFFRSDLLYLSGVAVEYVFILQFLLVL